MELYWRGTLAGCDEMKEWATRQGYALEQQDDSANRGYRLRKEGAVLTISCTTLGAPNGFVNVILNMTPPLARAGAALAPPLCGRFKALSPPVKGKLRACQDDGLTGTATYSIETDYQAVCAELKSWALAAGYTVTVDGATTNIAQLGFRGKDSELWIVCAAAGSAKYVNISLR
jgi:hypothetical protein